MTSKEAYQQAALILVGTRRNKQSENIAAFISNNRSLVDDLNARWTALEDRTGVPSPTLVISWL